ncbi:MarR family transcriptional regulator [Nocardioides massiliensis]|uniref:DNA-binding MarR family transcriptional regulator n=1 Tax=Nocardioides massiliensis TaxID=1325935 RepID=A0ABT9NP25_9ACTN|nr:MarR family transcriptional regulator [Nocardioides massiliensis]MDP9822148.1 DNA-binding MarR family transcriptional regulator [Nocardioides massiliensis]
MAPTIEKLARTDVGLASALRLSVFRLVRRLRSERDPDNELSIGQLAVLGDLLREGEASVGELARRQMVQPPTMTRAINDLEAAGYVTRRACEDDGRRALISISDQGAATLAADRKRRDAWLARELRNLTPEERDALRTAAPILERLANA